VQIYLFSVSFFSYQFQNVLRIFVFHSTVDTAAVMPGSHVDARIFSTALSNKTTKEFSELNYIKRFKFFFVLHKIYIVIYFTLLMYIVEYTRRSVQRSKFKVN